MSRHPGCQQHLIDRLLPLPSALGLNQPLYFELHEHPQTPVLPAA